jgi:hypothetical protein
MFFHFFVASQVKNLVTRFDIRDKKIELRLIEVRLFLAQLNLSDL